MALISLIKKVIKKPVIFFTASRYMTYILQFLRGLFIAAVLGEFFFGIWGFIVLIQQYLSYGSFGVQHAVNTELATGGIEDEERASSLISSSIQFVLFIGIVLLGLGVFIELSDFRIFPKYNFSEYAFPVLCIGILILFRDLFANIYRVYNILGRVAIGEIIYIGIPLIMIFFFREDTLIKALLYSMIGSLIIANVVFLFRRPFRLSFKIDPKNIRYLLSIGIPLLVYNVSLVMIMIASRTIVSAYYDVSVNGYFSFAFAITNATLLGLNAVSWVFYPVMLSKVREDVDTGEALSITKRVTVIFTTTALFVTLSGALFSPVLFIILPDYAPAMATLNILFLTQGIYSVNFSFSSFAIARKKHLQLAGISLVSLVFVLLINFYLALQGLDIKWIAFSAFIGTGCYIVMVSMYVQKVFGQTENLIKFALSPNMLIPIAFFLVGNLYAYQIAFSAIGYVLFLILNIKRFKTVYQFIKKSILH